MHTARASNAVVSELYPSVVRDRMFPVVKDQASSRDLNQCKCNPPLNESSLREREKRESKTSSLALSIPIADLFPDTTVMFADIAGFTAWSSTRDPTQVFTLLETLYRGFDKIAAERRVFKVETIGDSYVAVVGLPDSRKDHAVVMSKFARDCRESEFHSFSLALFKHRIDTAHFILAFIHVLQKRLSCCKIWKSH